MHRQTASDSSSSANGASFKLDMILIIDFQETTLGITIFVSLKEPHGHANC
jgi:hypothetical protein